MIKVIAVLCLLVVNSNSYAALIFKFDNAEFPGVDFVGVESAGVHIYFGPDNFDIGDSFDLLIGATPWASDYGSTTEVNLTTDDISGFGFGGTLNLLSLSETFFVTIVNKSGSFNVSGITAYFSNNGNGANFQGVLQRVSDPVYVDEPTSLWLLLIALGFMWRVVIVNARHNA